MINHREFTIAYLELYLLRYYTDYFVRNQTDTFLRCPSISLVHTRLLDVPRRLSRMHSSEYSAKEP